MNTATRTKWGWRVWTGVVLLLAGSGIFLGCEGESPANESGAAVKIGRRVWRVELAMTADARYKGLSGRTHLSAEEGMLFIYPQAKLLSFCMRDCEIPIDIAFLDKYGRIVQTYEMQVEPDRIGLRTYSSNRPAVYALELAGGTLRECGISQGDVVELIRVPPPHKAQPDE